MRTFGHLSGTESNLRVSAAVDRNAATQRSEALEDLLVILVVEDSVQGVVEEAVTDGDFEPAAHLSGQLNGWEVALRRTSVDATQLGAAAVPANF
jgi:hypothetical protein